MRLFGFRLFGRKAVAAGPGAVGLTWHWLRASGGGWLICAHGQTAQGLICQAQAPAVWRVLLGVPPGDANFGVLTTGDAGPMTIAGGPGAGPAVAVWIEHTGPGDNMRIVHPQDSKLRLTRLNHGGECGFGFTRQGADRAAQDFIAVPLPDSAIAPPALALGQEVAPLVQHPALAAPIFASLQAGRLRPTLLEALLSRLPTDQLQHFYHLLEQNPGVFAKLAKKLGADPWLGRRLAALLAWSRKRTPAKGPLHLPANETADLPGTVSTAGHRPLASIALMAAARLSLQPMQMACVIGSARNEGPYLLEWVAHYRATGFSHIFLYTNDLTDGSDKLLTLLAKAGVISWIDQEIAPGTLPQHRAYAHALSVLPQILDYRWSLIADLDEFFAFDQQIFSDLGAYLAWQERAGADIFGIPWLLFGAAQPEPWRNDTCLQRFTQRQPKPSHQIKSFFRTNRFWTSNCHYPIASLGYQPRMMAQDATPHLVKMPDNNLALSQHPKATHAWLAHYVHKTAPELLMKIARGQGDVSGPQEEARIVKLYQDFLAFRRPGLVGDARMAPFALAQRGELARLRALPGVAAAEAQIKSVYTAAMAQTMARFLAVPTHRNEHPTLEGFRAELRASCAEASGETASLLRAAS